MVKEWKIGKHEAVYNEEHNVLIVNVKNDFEAKDVEDYIRVSGEAFPGMTSGRNMMIVFEGSSRGPMMTKDARDSLKRKFQEAGDMGGDKIAIIGASPGIRMISKVIVKVTGSANTKFFKSEREAFQWFKEK